MNRLESLKNRCDRQYETTRRIRRLVGEKVCRGKQSTEEVLRSDAGLAASFATGVLVDQWRQSRRDATQPEQSDSTGGNGVRWASLVVRTALPYAIQGLTASSAEAATASAEQIPA